MGRAACWRKVRLDFWIFLSFSLISSQSGSTVWIPAPRTREGRLCEGMTGLGRDSAGPEDGLGGCEEGSGDCMAGWGRLFGRRSVIRHHVASVA